MNKKHISIVCIVIYVISTLFFWKEISAGSLTSLDLKEGELGKLCVAQVFPNIDKKIELRSSAKTASKEDSQQDKKNVTVSESSQKDTDSAKKKVKTGKPKVIIYHTHSTESYQPYNGGNFHKEDETGTVRDVGNVLTEELEKQGIGVVHDKTLHDRPSYNASYDRSLETILSLLKKYPTATYVIDLHRDAAAYEGNNGKTMKIGGTTVAKYSLVVGQNNENYSALINFAKTVRDKSNALYSGFGGEIIEKQYKFNEYVVNNCLLLEIGNNQNTIQEARATAKYFAKVLGAIINEK